MDTIFALSTGPGRAGVAVIRISGPAAHESVRVLAGDVTPARYAALRHLRDAEGSVIDQAIVVCFDGDRSFTGEKMSELQCHGSPAVVRAILERLSLLTGYRAAEPGEFTRRALENGKLDLSQVEGLSDLLAAETEAQRKQAIRVMDGELANKVGDWRARLIRSIALIEATIDFADEDIPEDFSQELIDNINFILPQLEREVLGFSAAERIRQGFEVAIVGAPNVGKSTLLNALAGRDAAITSSYAGTTRDVIEVRMDLKGLPVTLLDTAGLRETTDELESMGIERARIRARAADLRVFLLAPGDKPDFETEEDDIVLTAKADLYSSSEMAVSGLTGKGITELMDRIVETLELRVSNAGLVIRERHRIALMKAISSLQKACQDLTRSEMTTEFIAEELRTAVRALDIVVGRFDIEDVLDEIFSAFCLGK